MIFTTLFFAAVHNEIAKWDEINAIAHAKIGTPEFRRLMMQLNERGGL